MGTPQGRRNLKRSLVQNYVFCSCLQMQLRFCFLKKNLGIIIIPCGSSVFLQRFGRLPWKDLFQPAIALAKMGIPVTPFFGKILAFNKKVLLGAYGDENMR